MPHPYWSLDDNERERVDHDDMIECATEARYTPMQRRAFGAAHDRIYGAKTSCRYCQEPILERVQQMFENTP